MIQNMPSLKASCEYLQDGKTSDIVQGSTCFKNFILGYEIEKFPVDPALPSAFFHRFMRIITFGYFL